MWEREGVKNIFRCVTKFLDGPKDTFSKRAIAGRTIWECQIADASFTMLTQERS
jgi:hypothetical protein